MSRPFNKKAYDAFDMKNKKILVDIMKKKGYELVGEIDKEYYKQYDLKFKKGDKELTFENETRVNFSKIRDIFPTIHIPIRKQKINVDYYVVWKPELDEFFLISKEVISNHREKIVTLVCNEFDEENRYEDSFVDIPKQEAILFKLINTKWRKINNGKI